VILEVIANYHRRNDPLGQLKQEIPMSGRLIALPGVVVAFGVLTFLALMEVGYLGLLEPALHSWGAAQVLVDLVIVGFLACIWMLNDARERGVSAWPFVALTLVLGSFGPLLYLVSRELKSGSSRSLST
jgi:hypothetical protein